MNGFSQTVTETKDTTHIVLSTKVARMVAIDLVLGDKARVENDLLTQKINALNGIVTVQDSLLATRNSEIKTYQELREVDKTKIKDQEASIEKLKKDVARQSKLKTGFQIATGVSVSLFILFLVVK